MDITCGTYVGEQWCIQGFHRETDHLEELCIDGRITFTDLQEVQQWGGAQTDLAPDRDKCQALVIMVMYFWVP